MLPIFRRLLIAYKDMNKILKSNLLIVTFACNSNANVALRKYASQNVSRNICSSFGHFV
jgi:hypothetical protein